MSTKQSGAYFPTSWKKGYVTFLLKNVHLGVGQLMVVVGKGGSWYGWQWLEECPCQLGLGIRVASQMPNQVDRCMVGLPGKMGVCGWS